MNLEDKKTAEALPIIIEIPTTSFTFARYLQEASRRDAVFSNQDEQVVEFNDRCKLLQFLLDRVLSELFYLLSNPPKYSDEPLYKNGKFCFGFEFDNDEIATINAHLVEIIRHGEATFRNLEDYNQSKHQELLRQIIDIIKSCDPKLKAQGTRKQIAAALAEERKKWHLMAVAACSPSTFTEDDRKELSALAENVLRRLNIDVVRDDDPEAPEDDEGNDEDED